VRACVRLAIAAARVRRISPSSQEPELLEVTDVGEIPDERRLEWRDLARELLVRERLQQSFGPPSRVLESEDKLRP
jgi:hypothetical protein